MSDKLLAVKDNGASGLSIQRIEAADAKTMLDVPVVDDTLSIAGAAAEAKATGDAIDDLKTHLGYVAITRYNYLNPEIVQNGKYIKGLDNETYELGKNEQFKCALLPVVSGKTYYVPRVDFPWMEIDENGTILKRHNISLNPSYNVSCEISNANTKYLGLSWMRIAANAYMVTDPGTSFDPYAPYPHETTLTSEVMSASDIATMEEVNENITASESATEDKIEQIATIKYNYFDKSEAQTKSYIKGDVGSAYQVAENSTYNCILMPVVVGKTYVLERTDYPVFQIDSNGIILTKENPNTETHERSVTITNQNAAYLGFSWMVIPPDQYMVLDTGVSFSKYINYPYSVEFSEESLESLGIKQEEVYTVGGNSADFATFTDMLIGLKDNDKKKTVYVNSGVYNIFDEIGGYEFVSSIVDPANTNWREVNEIVPPNTTIIGVGDVTLKFTPTDAEIIDSAHAFLFSPLHLTWSCHIENLTLEASNCRYALHCENGQNVGGDNTRIEIVNVRCKRTSGNMGLERQVFGSGIGYNCVWVIKDCRFISDAPNIFTVHTNAPNVADTSSTITLDNCIIANETETAQSVDQDVLKFISAYLPQSIHNFAHVNNCYVGGKIATEVSNTMKQAFDVDVVGGTYYGLNEDPDATSGYNIQVYGANLES